MVVGCVVGVNEGDQKRLGGARNRFKWYVLLCVTTIPTLTQKMVNLHSQNVYDAIFNAYIRHLEEMRVVDYSITGTETVLGRIKCEIRIKMAENGHVAQLLKQCHTGTCEL